MAPPQPMDVDDVEMEEDHDQEHRLINEEYKTWKKNSPFLYDMILSTALAWPTLTVQWLPDVKEPEGKNYRVHRVLLGTHTSESADEYLQIAEVEIPKSIDPNPDDYDEDRGEIGGYGGGKGSEAAAIKWNITQKINHEGEVNRARYQPQNPDIIATACINGTILVFDRTKHSLTPKDKTVSPQFRLEGHKAEGYGLNWSPHEEGCLVSGSNDHTVLLWDLKNVQADGKALKPSRKFTHHSQIVNDVQYHPIAKHFIGTVSDDLTLQILDTRSNSNESAALVARGGHSDAINALDFSPSSEFLVATASGDKTIGIWDLRNVKDKIHTLESHRDAVTSVSWHPHEAGVLGSGSYDRRVLFWDLSRAGEEQQPDDAEDGPPELLFMHGGHTNHLADFSWNPNEPWMVCSAAEDNLLQVWKVADSIVRRDDGDLPVDELGP
ncbi:histone acetyltransferase type B subunit 2 [Gaeumannomyces tritici R3-111a-1]|uniref:Histone acetyltransferase type B subunit 2 n=1 Tax=Gaeumannomyces tritici (strain R3-111a-1) TaxID=644352 RepID=J3P0Q7_GAET3|nr:histone acetyltransferase type B subunit 2 [Gaeumannomyces tritici R3-111a-1]EJT77190.1 histone acetyltransferase type B subunit 2 [Gaeumannomyces tritici R3-111a-1]